MSCKTTSQRLVLYIQGSWFSFQKKIITII